MKLPLGLLRGSFFRLIPLRSQGKRHGLCHHGWARNPRLIAGMIREHASHANRSRHESSSDRSRSGQILSILIEGLVLISVAVIPWMCPGDCVRPLLFWGSSFFEIGGMGSRLVFSILTSCLVLLWTFRLLVRWRFDWKRCPVT